MNDRSKMHYSWAVSISAGEKEEEEEEPAELENTVLKKTTTKTKVVNDSNGTKIRATRTRCNQLYNIYVGMFKKKKKKKL